MFDSQSLGIDLMTYKEMVCLVVNKVIIIIIINMIISNINKQNNR